MKATLLFIVALLIALALPLLDRGDRKGERTVPAEGLPWQIEKLADGNIRVFGLVPGTSTFDEARQRHGRDVQVALLVAPGEAGSVEAYYESFAVGGVTGRMILTLATTAQQHAEMLSRARKAEYMEGATRKVELGESDLAQLGGKPIAAIAFIPSANLDEQIVAQRFGPATERIRSSEHTEHFLYPDRGLDLRLDAKGKEVLQYVAPRDFGRLRDPLLKPAGASSG